MAKKKKENLINSPPHYTQGEIESIEYIEDCGHGESFCIGNVIKYVSRYEHKNGLEDLKKAQWYLNRVISSLEITEDELEAMKQFGLDSTNPDHLKQYAEGKLK